VGNIGAAIVGTIGAAIVGPIVDYAQ
jgi:hypothetical protein